MSVIGSLRFLPAGLAELSDISLSIFVPELAGCSPPPFERVSRTEAAALLVFDHHTLEVWPIRRRCVFAPL